MAAVDTGVVTYVLALSHNWFDTDWDPTNHTTILLITIILLAIQTTLNITGVKVMGLVARFGVFVEIVGHARDSNRPGDPRVQPRTRLPVLH